MKKLLTAALTAAALVLPAAVSYAAPAAKAASASHSGDAARQTDSRQSSAMNQTHTAVSKYSFDDTVRRLETAVKEKGMTVFAVIDHQAAARQSGLDMQPAKVIVFGTPKKTPPSPCNCRCASSLPKLTAQSKSYSTIRARWCRAAKSSLPKWKTHSPTRKN